MPTNAARPPLTPGRRRTAIALGAVFVGSSLVAVMSPAHAEPSPSASASPSPSAPPSSPEPVPSAVVSFERDSDEVKLGDSAVNPLTATNTGDASVCLLAMSVDTGGFGVRGFTPQEVAPGEEASAGEVTGATRERAEVTATLTYALAQEGVACAVLEPASTRTVATGTWTVSIARPEPTTPPEQTGEPTDEPTETEEPDDTTSPSDTPRPDPTRDDDRGGNSGGGSGGSGGGRSGGSGDAPRSSGRVDDVPTSDVPTTRDGFPDLPSDEAALPGVVPGAENLAELPTVTPGAQDDDLDETEVAADHSDLGPNMAPAVLLAAFLLALLLAAPLAPVRRVRVGGGYQGRRRRK
ncbi:hypothetical protein [Nocardiopsis dassonvillei]|uniref:hypothetical protein n=1 Tax=Nocardiopsis dassonvillei TaxID=2014 RepID=UPI00157C374A|nr:hypothetical protein [Nocardiopsis dassonvillei]